MSDQHLIHTTFNIATRSEVYKYAAYDGLQQLSGRNLQIGAASLQAGD